MGETKGFPVLLTDKMRRQLAGPAGLKGCPDAVPWWLVEPHAQQAYANHGQSLVRLAERGGLSPDELVAVLEDRKWTPMVLEGAVSRIRVLLNKACPVSDDEEQCTCDHVRGEHAEERHECSAFDPGDYDGAPDVPCACVMFEPVPDKGRAT